jgi:hypothetical protein
MIYLLHYDTPLHHAQHYLGSCDDPQRIQDHGSGTSRARLPQVFCELGVQFVVARTWEGSRTGERKLKNQKNARVLCPICRLHKLTVRAKQQRARRAQRKVPFGESPRSNTPAPPSITAIEYYCDRMGATRISLQPSFESHILTVLGWVSSGHWSAECLTLPSVSNCRCSTQ